MNEHYKAFEPQTIVRMQQVLTDEEFQGFCRGNIIKYVERLRLKDEPVANARKIVDYAHWLYQSLCEEEISYGIKD